MTPAPDLKNKMIKQLLKLALLALVAANTQYATAVKYNSASEDLLLVIRNGSKDMVWDVGTVSNILAVAPGNTYTVTNYVPATVVSTFGSYNAAGLDFVLVAASSDSDPNTRIWATDADLVNVPPQLSGSDWGNYQGKVKTVGTAASGNSTPVNSTTTNYVTTAGNANSYSYIVSESVGGDAVLTWNGNLPFTPESGVGTTQDFYELSTGRAGKLLGTFTMSGSTGVVTFTAASGLTPPTLLPSNIILPITRVGSSVQISFTTTNSNNYQLLYTTSLTPPVTWVTNSAAGTATGDGSTKSLTDTGATDAKRFYRIQSFY